MTTRVTRLTESDWRMFAALRLRALTESLGENDPQFREEVAYTAAQWRRRLREHAQFAVLTGDRAVGLIAAHQRSDDTVYLYSLWLDPSARGRGLARRLLTAALEWARDRRVRAVTLKVAADNSRARGVYERLGFTATTSDVTGVEDEVAMRLSVS